MIDLVILDVNETLFPLDPVAERMAEVGLEGQLELWFTRVLRDGIAAAAASRFAAFSDLARHHLLGLLAGRDHTDPEAAVRHVLDGFLEVRPHPDVAAGLGALREAGVPAVALTNGSADLTRAFLERAGLADLVAAVHDVSEVHRWKPAPDAYRHVLERHGVAPGSAAMVAVHRWDLLGAQAAGMVAALLDRDGGGGLSPLGTPDLQAATLDDLVTRLLRYGHPR